MLNLELARTLHDERQRQIDARSRVAALLRSPESPTPIGSPAVTDGHPAPRRAKLSTSDRPG